MAAFETLDVDVFATDQPAITFSEDNQTWTVAAGVLASSSDDDGVFSARNGSSLFNNGSIASNAGHGAGVRMLGPGSVISNAVDANIVGLYDGINIGGHGAVIANQGAILGLTNIGIEFDSTSDDVTLNNAGSIYGRVAAVRVVSDNDGGAIRNAGVIRSVHDGIAVVTIPGLTTSIVNTAGATIRGGSGPGDSAISVVQGQLSINNHGTIVGNVVSLPVHGVSSDVLVNAGRIAGDVLLGNGNDVFIGTGGTAGGVFGDDGSDRLLGGNASDKLYGGDDGDRLVGAAGNDTLDGGRGFDTLIGGAGRDRFIFQFDIAPAPNIDRIPDFVAGIDKIVLEETVFQGIGHAGVLATALFHVGTAAQDGNDRIIYNPNNGFLIYDANGSRPGGAVHFATLAPHLALTHSDFLVTEILVA